MTFMTKLIILPLLLITSCAQLPISYVDTPMTIYRAMFGYPNESISNNTYDSYEYSFAKVRFGKGKSAIMILASIDNDLYTWIGSDGVQIITSNGRIVKTDGLPNNIHILQTEDRRSSIAGHFFEVVNFDNPVLLNSNLESLVSFKNYADYEYLENSLKAQAFHEAIAIDSIGWKEHNYYYFDTQNKALKTSQFIHPFLDKIEMEFYLK